MPTYDYKCKKCGESISIVKGINEKFESACPDCGGELNRVYTSFYFSIQKFAPKSAKIDSIKKNLDMREELKEKHMVHGVTPLRGQTVADVYREINKSGGKVREEMQRSSEQGLARARAENKARAEALKPKLKQKNEEIMKQIAIKKQQEKK
jgi:putative FmdB family regulatory protein